MFVAWASPPDFSTWFVCWSNFRWWRFCDIKIVSCRILILQFLATWDCSTWPTWPPFRRWCFWIRRWEHRSEFRLWPLTKMMFVLSKVRTSWDFRTLSKWNASSIIVAWPHASMCLWNMNIHIEQHFYILLLYSLVLLTQACPLQYAKHIFYMNIHCRWTAARDTTGALYGSTLFNLS